MKNIIVYNSVFDRNNPKQYTFEDFLNPEKTIFKDYNFGYNSVMSQIKSIENKAERNDFKRNNLLAASLAQSSILSIDIDNLDKEKVERIVNIMRLDENVYAIKETASGNVVLFFRYDCKVQDFKFLYYKLYLELTLKLSTNIDFLPEIDRLRYITNDEVYYFNKDSKIVTEILAVEQLPYINTQVSVKDARKIKYSSK